MPFSSRYNCLFIHIPKTGGTTVEKLLDMYREWPTLDLEVLMGRLILGDQEYQLQHLSFRDAAQFVSEELLRKSFTFSFVRNPWDRMVSEYFWRCGDGMQWEFEPFVDWVCDTANSREELEGRNCHFRPQVEFLDGAMSFLGRFERFHQDLNFVLAELGLDARDIPHERKIPRGKYRDYYSDRLQKRVGDTYECDIDTFKYTF
jgi:hypothetical protein